MLDETRVFDEEAYLEENPDVAEAVNQGLFQSALAHFQAFGKSEGRSPTPFFDADAYLEKNPDVAEAIQAGVLDSAWEHFAAFGTDEGRAPNRMFDPEAYRETNQDVAEAGMDATEHFLQFGAFEGRDLGNGVSLQDFANDSKFQQAAAQGNAAGVAARVTEVAPFIPSFAPPAGDAAEVIERLQIEPPDDFEPPSEDFVLSLPPGLQMRIDDLPPAFQDPDNLPPPFQGGFPGGGPGNDDPDDTDEPDDMDEPDEEDPEEPAEEPTLTLSLDDGVIALDSDGADGVTLSFADDTVVATAGDISEDLAIPDGDLDGIDGLTVTADTALTLTLDASFAVDGEEIAAGDFGTLTLSGGGNLTLVAESTALDAFGEIDASGLDGGLTLDASGSEGDLTIAAGSGSDSFTLGGGTATLAYTDAGQSFDGESFGEVDSIDGWDGDILDFSALGAEALAETAVEAGEDDDLEAVAQQAVEALETGEVGTFAFDGNTYVYANLSGEDSLDAGDVMVEIVGQHELSEDNFVLFS